MQKMRFSKRLRVAVAAGCMAMGLMGGLELVSPVPAAAAGYTVPQKSPITVLPIGNAKFLTGQQFDFLIEVKDIQPQDISVTINGQDAAGFFGKEAVRGTHDGIATYRIDAVQLRAAGKVDIVVKAGGESRRLQYTATAEQAVKRAKNVILMIGDGMSLQAREMARVLAKGMTEGRYNDLLEMEKMPHMAVITTSGYDSLVTDSANSASAYATGQKGTVNAMGVYSDSTKDPLDDPKVENIVELAKRTRGMATGIVSTANITDATPAAMVAHTRRRAEQNFIASTMLDPVHRPDVILGGGSRHFLPMATPGSKRKDAEDLVKEFKGLGYALSTTKSELDATPAGTDKLLGLYQLNNMDVYIDRAVLRNPQVLHGFMDQPGLVDMTQKAIGTLSRNPHGFFLMVEGACIDKQLHTLDWQRATYDTIEFDQAVAAAKRFAAQRDDTLIIVVADHAHGASITGTYSEKDGQTGREAVHTYAAAGFPTFEDRDGDGYPDNPDPEVTLAVQFANHPDANISYRFREKPTVPAIMADGKAIANPAAEGVFSEGNIPANEDSEVHSADDILLNAMGPGSEYFNGVMDNTEVFFGMVRALGLDGLKK